MPHPIAERAATATATPAAAPRAADPLGFGTAAPSIRCPGRGLSPTSRAPTSASAAAAGALRLLFSAAIYGGDMPAGNPPPVCLRFAAGSGDVLG